MDNLVDAALKRFPHARSISLIGHGLPTGAIRWQSTGESIKARYFMDWAAISNGAPVRYSFEVIDG